MPDGLRDTYKEFLINTEPLSSKIVPLRRKSETIGVTFNEVIDFLFIDGNHEYDYVKKDICIYLPKIRRGGVLIMHDSGWAEGVQKVITDDVLCHLQSFRFTPNMFIGILK